LIVYGIQNIRIGVYLPLRMVICLDCHVGLDFSRLLSHLNFNHSLKLNDEDLDALNQDEFQEITEDLIHSYEHNIPQIMVKDGYKCQHCNYITKGKKQIQEHKRNQGHRNSIVCQYQTVMIKRGNSKVFKEYRPEEHLPMNDFNVAEVIANNNLRLKNSNTEPVIERKERDLFHYLTFMKDFLEAFDVDQVIESVSMPDANLEANPYLNIKDDVDSYYQFIKTQYIVNATNQNYGLRLIAMSKSPSDNPLKAFNSLQEIKSENSYSETVVKFLCFLIRVFLNRDSDFQEREAYDFSPDDEIANNIEIRERIEQYDQNIRDQDRLNVQYAPKDFLHMVLLSVFKSKLRDSSNTFDFLIYQFICFNALKEDGELRPFINITHSVVHLKFFLRLCFLYEASKPTTTQNEIDQLRLNFYTHGSFKSISQLKSLAESASNSTLHSQMKNSALPVIVNGKASTNQVKVNGTTISLSSISNAVKSASQLAESSLKELRLGFKTLIRGHEILDNHDFYSTFYEDDPLLKRKSTEFRSYVESGNQNVRHLYNADSSYNLQAIKKWVKKAENLLENLLILIHLSSGNVARGSEYRSLMLRGLADKASRNIYWEFETITIIPSYIKTRSVMGHDSRIARFCPPSVAMLLLEYLVYIRPIEMYILIIDQYSLFNLRIYEENAAISGSLKKTYEKFMMVRKGERYSAQKIRDVIKTWFWKPSIALNMGISNYR
jgi:hypothetical protein